MNPSHFEYDDPGEKIPATGLGQDSAIVVISLSVHTDGRIAERFLLSNRVNPNIAQRNQLELGLA